MFGLAPRHWFRVLLVLAIFYVVAQYIPPYLYGFQFNDAVREEVRFAEIRRRSAEDLRISIIKRADENYIPLDPKNIKITRKGKDLTVDVTYTMPVNLVVYQHVLQFHVVASGETLEP